LRFQKNPLEVPSGKTYNFYGQKIDLDLELPKNKINSATKKPLDIVVNQQNMVIKKIH
jgi:hypothetical protein